MKNILLVLMLVNVLIFMMYAFIGGVDTGNANVVTWWGISAIISLILLLIIGSQPDESDEWTIE